MKTLSGPRKRGALGQIKKPPVEATAWCYTGTRYEKSTETDILISTSGRTQTSASPGPSRTLAGRWRFTRMENVSPRILSR